MRVLVGYASRFGSTKEIAAHIAERLRRAGVDADARDVLEIGDVAPYGAVVFGSGVYDGSWTPNATAWLRGHAAELTARPVWLFSVGSFGDRHPVIGHLIVREPKDIGEIEQLVHPREYRVFAGVLDLQHWPAWGRLVFKALGGRDGDNRHWPDIDAWADAIAQALRPV
ncbi:MAG: flavodoxin domain-containing protein [Acidobacteria bacterium]|nr:flavodoxin domain-containing protein [Acidobacteriota bacterium]